MFILSLHIKSIQLYDRYTSPDLTSILHDLFYHFPLGMCPLTLHYMASLSDRTVQLVRQQLYSPLTLQLTVNHGKNEFAQVR